LRTLIDLLLSKKAQKLIKLQRNTTVLEEYEPESDNFSDFDLKIENLKSLSKSDSLRNSEDDSDANYIRLYKGI
jgi:hypothetical protein